jgi:acetolactate synthase-1/2/3 large subunit
VGLFGDGSFGMSCGELETLSRLNVPAILIHFNNGCFGWIKALQKLHNAEQYLSVDFTGLDAARIAEAFGLKAWRVSTALQLEAALDGAFAHVGPVLIDVVVESIVDELPAVYSWMKATGKDPLMTV